MNAHSRRLAPALVAGLVMIGTLGGPPAAHCQTAPAPSAANFDWTRFGSQVMANADYYTKQRLAKASMEDRAKYVAQEVGRQMNILRIMPNRVLLERGVAKARYGDQQLGTCGDVSASLRKALAGSGIDDRRLLYVKGERIMRGPLDVNVEHGALVFLTDNGKPIVFDLWLHAGEHGTFGSFESSIWFGVDLENWSNTLLDFGYTKQGCEDCADSATQSPTKMMEAVANQSKALNEVPSGAVRFMVYDARTGKPLAGASVTASGAINSPVEKIRVSAVSDASGQATLGGVKMGPYTVFVRHAACTPFESELTNLQPLLSKNIRLQCEEEVQPRRPTEPEARPVPRKPDTPPRPATPAGSSEEDIVGQYRALLPASLNADKKPWHTRFEIIANAEKVAGGYKVNYKTYCLIEKGPDQGKDYACYEFDATLDFGQIKSAVADMKKRLGR